MDTLQYLDAAKVRLGIESDYALAKALGIRASTIAGYKSRGGQMDDEIATKVAAAAGIHPGIVMLDMHRARAKTPAEQSIWQEIFEGFLTLLPRAKSVGSIALPR